MGVKALENSGVCRVPVLILPEWNVNLEFSGMYCYLKRRFNLTRMECKLVEWKVVECK